ncbi:unnamed protein product [Sphagnum balticum]
MADMEAAEIEVPEVAGDGALQAAPGVDIASAAGETQVKETRSEMLSRHLKEIKELQGKEIALKKAAAAKGSKAEQKAKKKIAEEEVSKLDAKLRAQHAKELALLGFQGEDSKDVKGLETLVKAIAGVSTTAPSQQARLSKGQKWRDRRVQQDAEREQRIKQEQESVVSDRVREDQQLERKLCPLGFSLKEMKPDGHCLYRAVADQLSLYPDFCPQHSYQQLRSLAAAYMHTHADVFLPFVAAESTGDSPTGKDLQSKFEVYCREIESTATWGGQLELEALAHALRRHIVVYAGNSPDVEMGKEYSCKHSDPGLLVVPTLRISYHRHAFRLGEHYNSVVPLNSSGLLPDNL